MFLTRMGFGSKVVITGDVTQIDLPADKTSGLQEVHLAGEIHPLGGQGGTDRLADQGAFLLVYPRHVRRHGDI